MSAIAAGCPQDHLFVCLSVSSVLENEAESPILGFESPGTINRNMRDMAGNAGRCFDRIKRVETDSFAQ